MDKIIPGLILAGLSAISFIAYQHPRAYEKMFLPLEIVVVAAFIGIGVWNVSSGFTHDAMRKYCDYKKSDEINADVERVRVSWWAAVALIVLGYYLMFLFHLPTLLGQVETAK